MCIYIYIYISASNSVWYKLVFFFRKSENQPFSTGEITRFSSDIYCVHCWKSAPATGINHLTVALFLAISWVYLIIRLILSYSAFVFSNRANSTLTNCFLWLSPVKSLLNSSCIESNKSLKKSKILCVTSWSLFSCVKTASVSLLISSNNLIWSSSSDFYKRLTGCRLVLLFGSLIFF